MHKLILVCLLVLQPILLVAETGKQDVYTVGIVPQFEARKIHAIWRPILDALEARVGVRFVLVGAATIPAFEQEFSSGSFDFAYMNPYHLIIANKTQGYVPLVNDNGKSLHGILVVPAKSPIKSASDLDGQTIAFPSPNALGASLMIRADMANVYDVEYVSKYVQSHSSVYLNVALNRVAAGGGVQKTFNAQPKDIQDRLRIIHRTEEVASHPFAAHERVSHELRTKVKEALIALGDSPEGMALLSKVPIRRIGPVSIQQFQSLEEMGLQHFYIGAP